MLGRHHEKRDAYELNDEFASDVVTCIQERAAPERKDGTRNKSRDAAQNPEHYCKYQIRNHTTPLARSSYPHINSLRAAKVSESLRFPTS